MTRLTLTFAALLAGMLGFTADAEAQRRGAEPAATLELTPWAGAGGEQRPHRYVFRLRPNGLDPVEVVADRRLLTFEVRPPAGQRGRRHICRHPSAPRRVPEGRVRRIGAGADDAIWEEWVDLRSYCWGAALRALESGAEVRPSFAFRARSARHWVARAVGASPRDYTRRLEAESFAFEARPAAETREVLADGEDPDADVTEVGDGSARLAIDLVPADARRGSGLRMRVRVGAREGTARVYIRPGDFSFSIRGPLGEVRCQMESGGGSPPPDLFRRVTARARASFTLDPDYFCPRDSFTLSGIYEVTPELQLRHSGSEHNIEAVVGRFAGPTVPFRVRDGDRGYVEQTLESVEAP